MNIIYLLSDKYKFKNVLLAQKQVNKCMLLVDDKQVIFIYSLVIG